jgi:hypothetical protein
MKLVYDFRELAGVMTVRSGVTEVLQYIKLHILINGCTSYVTVNGWILATGLQVELGDRSESLFVCTPVRIKVNGWMLATGLQEELCRQIHYVTINKASYIN